MIFIDYGNTAPGWHRRPLIALALLLLGSGCLTAAQPTDDIAEAQSTNDELLRTLQSRLTTEQLTLQKLTELKAQGYATWLEVAHAETAVAELQATYQAACDFDTFLGALHQRIVQPPATLHNDSPNNSDWRALLPEIALRIAAARARAQGDLQTGQLLLKKHQLRAAALEHLFIKSAASNAELSDARRNVAAAQSLLTRLQHEHTQHSLAGTKPGPGDAAMDAPLAAAATSPEGAAGSSPDREVAGTSQFTNVLRPGGPTPAPPSIHGFLCEDELRLDDIPTTLLNRRDFIHALLQLRNNYHVTIARQEMISSQLVLIAELLRRTEISKRKVDEADPEIDRIQLDLEILKAGQLAANERLTLLGLCELYLVAIAISQPNQDLATVIRIDSPTSALPLPPDGTKTNLSGGQTSPLTAAAWQPIAPNWPINNWSATRQIVAPSLPLSGNALIRYAEPHYADFYAFGNLRLDAPVISNSFFRNGSLPWYLPGSTTNFK